MLDRGGFGEWANQGPAGLEAGAFLKYTT